MGSRLLDIGCGAGAFLKIASSLGYAVIGLDPDAEALRRVAEFNVRQGSLPHTGFPDAHFEHITLSHVFEHLHDPHAALAEIARLLKPGGRIWLSLPNRDAIGLETFGKYWRGLEAPRHLVLPSQAGLQRLLEQHGFVDIRLRHHAPAAEFFVKQSLALQAGLDPYDETASTVLLTEEWRQKAHAMDRAAEHEPKRSEILVVTARSRHD
jgi:SAM-dependent methyltransferase